MKLVTYIINIYPLIYLVVGTVISIIVTKHHSNHLDCQEAQPLLNSNQHLDLDDEQDEDQPNSIVNDNKTLKVLEFKSGRLLIVDISIFLLSFTIIGLLFFIGHIKDYIKYNILGSWSFICIINLYILINYKKLNSKIHTIVALPLYFYIFSLFQSIYNHMKYDIKNDFYLYNIIIVFTLILLDLYQKLNVDDYGNSYISYYGRRPWKENESSYLGRAFFVWLTEFIRLGGKRPLEEDDLWDLREDDTSQSSLNKYYELKAKYPNRGFVFLTVLVCLKLMSLEVLCSFFSAILSVAIPFLLNRLLNWIKLSEDSKLKGIIILFLMFSCSIAKALFDGQMYFLGRRVSLKVRSIVVELIYQKSLRRAVSIQKNKKINSSNEDDKDEKEKDKDDKGNEEEEEDDDDDDEISASVGKVVTMMSVDTERLRDFMAYAHRLLLETSLLIILSVSALFYTIGWSAIASISVMLLNGPGGMWISKKIGVYQESLMKATDNRVNTTNEILQGIRIIKYFSWEPQFTKRINELRSSELLKLLRVWYCFLGFDLITSGCSILLTFVTFGCYTIIFKNTLTPETAFTAIALMNQITAHISGLPYEIMDFLKLTVSVKRIRKFLDEPELERYIDPQRMETEYPTTKDSPEIGFYKATFVYEGTDISNDPLDDPNNNVKHNIKEAKKAVINANAVDIPGLENDILSSEEPGRYIQGSVILTPSYRRRLSSLPKSTYLQNKLNDEILSDQNNLPSIPPSPVNDNLMPPYDNNNYSDLSITNNSSLNLEEAKSDSTSNQGFILRDLNISFPIGEFSIICGSTGSGKTSLLHALLGEMKRIKGRYFLPNSNDPKNQIINLSTGLRNTIAYASQSAWLINATIRDNILFGEPYDEKRYKNVIHACALARDFETLDGGDLTEIGEKGINVSGGQKARISLARACYSKAKTVLLDDVIAAVDAPTARHLVQQCFLGLLKNRTRILVSHAVSLVVPVSNYVVVVKSGEVIAQGKPIDIVKNQKAEGIYGLDLSNSIENSKDEDNENEEKASVAAKKGEGKDLVEAEGRSMGSVELSVYWLYFKAAGGALFLILFFLTFIVQNSLQVGLDVWLKKWSEAAVNSKSVNILIDSLSTTNKFSYKLICQSISNMFLKSFIPIGNNLSSLKIMEHLPTAIVNKYKNPVNVFDMESIINNHENQQHGSVYYITIYGVIGLLVIASQMTQAIYIVFSSIKASAHLHNILLEKVMGAPLRFFEVTPIGRILNRFSKDISSIDQNTVWSVLNFFQQVVRGLYILGTITFVSPPFAIAIIPVIFIYRHVAVLYLNASRELKRLDSITRSPLYSMFSETINGVTTIRAYGCEQRMIEQQRDKLDANHRAYFVLWVANRWLCLRTDLIGAAVVLASGLAVVLSNTAAGWAGLVITYSLSFSESLLWTIRMHAEMEMNMNSVERMMEYTTIEQEPPAVNKHYPPPPNWPAKGEITFKDLTIAYSTDLPPVLNDLNFVIKGGHKVGVVGRTGAGKSTLSLALFRILKFRKGTILVDDMDLSQMGIRELRSKFTIIPQDPVLFSGTLKSNLDPFNEHSSEELWESLKRVHVLQSILISLGISKKKIVKILEKKPSELNKNLSSTESPTADDDDDDEYNYNCESREKEALLKKEEDKDENSIISAVLNHSVKENGDNFSQGQRQLLCLARAILRNTKIIVMDEATASVDYETDARIQATMRACFDGATVLTIAHRLRTIMDYDRVLVLDKGKLAEYGTPYELATKEKGIFARMVKDSGDHDELIEIAKINQKK